MVEKREITAEESGVPVKSKERELEIALAIVRSTPHAAEETAEVPKKGTQTNFP